MKKTLVSLLFTLFALPTFAATSPLFAKYETVRQTLLAGRISAVQNAATDLAKAAAAVKEPAIAERSTTLSKAATLAAVRTAFAALSDEMIRFRAKQSGDRPLVVDCPMEKKSWLQPRGAIANPYLDGAMRSCGTIRE